MDLDRLLADPALDLPVPPNALAAVDAHARRIRRRRQALAVLPVLALAAIAGPVIASGGAGDRPTDVASAPTPEPTPSWTDVVRPVAGEAPAGSRARFQSYLSSLSQVDLASDRLRGRCMRAAGLPYADRSADRPVEYTDLPDQYGLSVAEAERQGYGIAVRLAAGDPVDPNQAHLESLSDAERQRWHDAMSEGGQVGATFDRPWLRGFGISLGGCAREAVVELWGSVERYGVAQFVVNGPGDIAGQARSHPQAVQLDARWSACMSLAGHPNLRDPEHAQSEAAQGYSGDRDVARARELAVAAADARCQERLAYGAARTSLEDRYFAGFVEQYPDVVRDVDAIVSAAAQRAADVLRAS